jgi:hypothetical protein
VTRTLLSAGIGVPIALAAMFVLFIIEVAHVTGRPRPPLARSSAVVIIAVLVFVIVARFVKYA